MDLRIAQAIKSAADDLGLEVTIRERYSGRGMYGKTTAALEYNREHDLMQAACQAAATAARIDELGLLEDRPDADAIIDGLPRRRDNMGLGYIAY